MKRIQRFFAAAIITVLLSSCGLMKIDEQIAIGGIEELSLKGLSAIELKLKVDNSSRFTIVAKNCNITIYDDNKYIATLEQVGEARTVKKTSDVMTTLWRISGVNPLGMLALTSRISGSNGLGLSLDYSVKVTVNGIGKTISGKRVHLNDMANVLNQIIE